MKWRDRKQSNNVEDRRGLPGYTGGGLSLGTIFFLWPFIKTLWHSKPGKLVIGIGAIAYVGYFLILPKISDGSGPQVVNEKANDELAAFIKTVHADTDAVWSRVFAQAGVRYPSPTLVLYRESTLSGCGPSGERMGPFYCPTDQKIYVDLGFFEDLERQYGADGDFARAYVLAHEVGHHIQNLEGTLNKVERAKQVQFGKGRKNALQVRVELQADCYAGLWAHHAQRQFAMLERGDLEEALVAAAAIGDDRLQKQAQGFSIPHTFTHGSSRQRVEWFSRGFKNGNLADCDTFQDAN
jgi:predicted metalloprotease